MSRNEALNLKHWEFESCRKFFYQQKARDALSNYQSVGMAFGGSKEDTKEYLSDLRDRAGYNTTRKHHEIVSNSEQGSDDKPVRAMGIFDNLLGVQTIETYKELKTNNFEGYGEAVS